MKNITNFLFLFFGAMCYSQNTNISGTIKDKLGIIKDAHVYNLTTKQGTYSNEKGAYSLTVNLGDEIQVSSIQHFNKKFTIANITLKQKKLNIVLTSKTYVLDEVEVKKHNLIGVLTTDIKHVTKDTIAELVNNLEAGILKTLKEHPSLIKYGKDEIHLKHPEPIRLHGTFTDAPSIAFGIDSRKGKQRQQQRKNQEALEQFPNKLKDELGEHFFFETLKIPKEQYYRFITYASHRNIKNLFDQKEMLKLIAILQEEAKSYLKRSTLTE